MNIVFTNGVFDIIHSGHIELLKYCKSIGDKVIVAIDTDERVAQIKGSNRPINNQFDRKNILESIKYVDEVLFFSSKEELQNLYKTTNCNLVVKGNERSVEEHRILDNIPDNIDIIMFSMKTGYSTTQILRKIQNLSSVEKI